MPGKERFGRFVLLEELGGSGLGTEYRAAKLAPGGTLERLVCLVRLTPALSGSSGFVKALMDQAKAASQLHGPSVLRLLAIGRVGSTCYLAYEHYDGKSLSKVLEKSRRDGFALAPDQALTIASKVCSGLEYASSKKAETGQPSHGLVTPDAVIVTYDGEVKLRGFGLRAAGIASAGGIGVSERAYLPPQGSGGAAADVYSVGALLFECLTGLPFPGAGPADPADALRETRLAPAGEGEPMPPAIAELLARALARDEANRHPSVAELRRAVDALLFAGAQRPTAFNLAFFVHTLFRGEIDRDARLVADETSASYAEYAADMTVVPGAPAPTPPESAGAARSAPAAPPAATTPRPPVAAAAETTGAKAVAAAREPGLLSAPMPVRAEPARRTTLVVAAGVSLALAVFGGWYFSVGRGRQPAGPPPTSLSFEARAALERVKDLESRLARFEQEKADAAAAAADEAGKKLEAQASSRGQAVDAAALQKAQDEARRRAQQEQDLKQQDERARLEREQRAAAEARSLAERHTPAPSASAPAASLVPSEARPAPAQPLPPGHAAPESAVVAPAASAASPSPSSPPPPATPSTTTASPPAAKLAPGSLVDLNDVGVLPPVLERQSPPQYPVIARLRRIEGTVELRVLVDENGNVVEAKVVTGAPGGLDQAAIDNVKGRKYRPATKDGVRVKVYLPVMVKFELSR